MPAEAATVMVIEIGSVFFFLLVLPLAVVLSRWRAVWRADRRTGFVLGGVIVLTGFFFALYLVGQLAIIVGGAWR